MRSSSTTMPFDFRRPPKWPDRPEILLGRKLGQSEQEAVSLGELLVRADLSVSR